MNSRQFLNINLGLGAVTAVANGGAAMMMLSDASQWSTPDIGEAILFAFIGLVLVMVGTLAIAGKISLPAALKWQAATLGGLLGLLTVWGMTILFVKSDRQIALSWMVGILSGLAIYCFHLVKHTFSRDLFEALRGSLLIVCNIAILVDISVFARVWLL